MALPRRATAIQALNILQQLADDESGEDNDDEDSDGDYSDTAEQHTNMDNEDADSDLLNISQSQEEEAEESDVVDARDEQVMESRGVVQGQVRGRGAVRGPGRGRCRGKSVDLVGLMPADEEVARDGTVWKRLTLGEVVPGRLQQQNILKEIPGPTPYAKRHIEDDSVTTAFSQELRAEYVDTQLRRNPVAAGNAPAADINVQRKRRHCQVRQCEGNKAIESCAMCKKITCGQCTATVTKRQIVICANCVGRDGNAAQTSQDKTI